MQTSDVIAILCSDVHLSDKPPVARSTEPNWMKAQEHVLVQVNDLAKTYSCPVVCAGDIFDKWDSSPGSDQYGHETNERMVYHPRSA